MMCGHCEAHVNDTIRQVFAVKEVSSSHSKNETLVISESELDEGALLYIFHILDARVTVI